MAEPEASDELKPKSSEQTAQRVLALLVAVGKVHDPERCVAWMKKHNLQRFLSPAEAAFVEEETPSEESRVAFSWRAEAMVSLLWALKALPEMPPLNEQLDVFRVEVVRAAVEDPLAFVSSARLRDPKEISDMESNLYHQHWRVRDAELVGIGRFLEPQPGDPPIEDLDPGIVYERRYGLSWLVGWGTEGARWPAGSRLRRPRPGAARGGGRRSRLRWAGGRHPGRACPIQGCAEAVTSCEVRLSAFRSAQGWESLQPHPARRGGESGWMATRQEGQ